MRATRIIGGIALSLFTTYGLAHAAGGQRQSSQPKQSAQQSAAGFRQSSATGQRLYVVSKGWVVRTSLPANGPATAAERIRVLKQSMEDEIEGVGHFKGDADTPAFEIVSHNANLKQIAEAGYGSDNAKGNGGVARYQVKASELKGGKLDMTVLLPVSGHVGLSNAQDYAKTNVFRLQVNGGSWESIPAKGKYVTEIKRSVALKPGLNTFMMEPYSGGFGGYSQGRTVEIEVIP
jgi:hypothetical protein